MRLTWTENKFKHLTFECHVDNKEWLTSEFFEVTEKWCPKFRVSICIWKFTGCPQKRRRVRGSVVCRNILIVCTPNWMVVGRLQNGLVSSSIAPWASRVNCQNIFFLMGLHIFFSNSDRDFYSENKNVSQVYT
jgi:hypothetical protein